MKKLESQKLQKERQKLNAELFGPKKLENEKKKNNLRRPFFKKKSEDFENLEKISTLTLFAH